MGLQGMLGLVQIVIWTVGEEEVLDAFLIFVHPFFIWISPLPKLPLITHDIFAIVMTWTHNVRFGEKIHSKAIQIYNTRHIESL